MCVKYGSTSKDHFLVFWSHYVRHPWTVSGCVSIFAALELDDDVNACLRDHRYEFSRTFGARNEETTNSDSQRIPRNEMLISNICFGLALFLLLLL